MLIQFFYSSLSFACKTQPLRVEAERFFNEVADDIIIIINNNYKLTFFFSSLYFYCFCLTCFLCSVLLFCLVFIAVNMYLCISFPVCSLCLNVRFCVCIKSTFRRSVLLIPPGMQTTDNLSVNFQTRTSDDIIFHKAHFQTDTKRTPFDPHNAERRHQRVKVPCNMYAQTLFRHV